MMNYPELAARAVENYLQRTGAAAFNLRAALIDMDGTLLDSMRFHTLAWHRMMTEEGISCTRDEFYLYEGMTGASTIKMLMKRERGEEPSKEKCAELYARKTVYFNEFPKVPIIPGADEVVQWLIDNGVKRVLVTGSGQESNLRRLDDDFPGGFHDTLRITARNVEHCKPHPEPYLKAMALAGVKPWESLVIENAPLGVQAGADAGAFTVAVTTGPIPVEEMQKAGADLVLPSMADLRAILPYLKHD